MTGGPIIATSVATFDDAGITGVGREEILLSSIVFNLQGVGILEPNIDPTQTPPGWRLGTFLAIYQDGEFDFLLSIFSGAFGYAQPDAQVFFPNGASGGWIYVGETGMTRRPDRTNNRAEYDLDRHEIVSPVSPVPVPGAALLFASALLGFLGLGRRYGGCFKPGFASG